MIALSLLLLGCEANERAPAADSPQLRPPPAACAELPDVDAAQLELAQRAAANGLAPFEPRSAFTGSGMLPLAVDYLFADSDATSVPAPLLIRSRTELEGNDALRSLHDTLEVDWDHEVLAVTRERRREASYDYALDGDSVVQIEKRAEPCLDPDALTSFRAYYNSNRILRLPRSVQNTRIERYDVRYRLPEPTAAAGCSRDAEPVIHGGGTPALVHDGSALRLYFGGFSAMTGNVFYGTSNDGRTFTPNGWDEAHLSRFEDRGPYAGLYGPFVERTADGFRMTVTSDALDVTSIVETTSTDGVHWGATHELLGGSASPFAPSRLATDDGVERLYYERDGAIRVAERSDPTTTFVEREAPALARPERLGGWAGLGYGGPHVVKTAGGWRMFVHGATGGIDADNPWRYSLGVADSADGLTFTAQALPWLVSAVDDETGGVHGAFWWAEDHALFYTAVNARFEPVVKRAQCAQSL